jgi:hypothetical protein
MPTISERFGAWVDALFVGRPVFGLEFRHLGDGLVGIRERLFLAALATQEHRLVFDHDLDRSAHRAEPVLGLGIAELLGLGQLAVVIVELGEIGLDLRLPVRLVRRLRLLMGAVLGAGDADA